MWSGLDGKKKKKEGKEDLSKKKTKSKKLID